MKIKQTIALLSMIGLTGGCSDPTPEERAIAQDRHIRSMERMAIQNQHDLNMANKQHVPIQFNPPPVYQSPQYTAPINYQPPVIIERESSGVGEVLTGMAIGSLLSNSNNNDGRNDINYNHQSAAALHEKQLKDAKKIANLKAKNKLLKHKAKLNIPTPKEVKIVPRSRYKPPTKKRIITKKFPTQSKSVIMNRSRTKPTTGYKRRIKRR